MKKKICYFITCTLMLITLTGCVKFKGNLDIKKDKTANYSILYAFDTTYLGNQEVLTDENKKTLEEQGFTVTDYNEGNYKGFNLSLKIDNIDKYSSTNDTNVDLSAITEGETSKYLFKIKKGFLKNTYTANFKNESTQNNTISDSTTDNSTITDDNSLTTPNTDTTTPNMDLSDLSSMMNNMDISFTVNLPYSAKSSNATNKSNKDKTLEWKMTDATSLESINFTFELYNMTNIYMLVGGILIVIVILIVLFTILKKKKGKKDDTNVPKVESNNTVTTTPVPNVVQPNIPPTESFTPPIETNNQPIQPEIQPVPVIPPVTNKFVPPVTPQAPVQPVPPVTPNPVNPVPTQNTFIPPMNNTIPNQTSNQPTNTFIPPVNNVPPVEPTIPNIPNSNIIQNPVNMPNNSQNDNTLYNQAFNSSPNNNQNNNM